MAQIEASQFEGCLLGALIGDCLGEPFQFLGITKSSQQQKQDYFDKLLKATDPEAGSMPYTDDTSMNKSILQSIIDFKAFDVNDLAKRFVETYFSETRGRNYGLHVPVVFSQLRLTNYEDVFKPASAQFNGTGSLGNGSGMRIAPIALYTIADTDLTRFTTMAVQTSRITHTHPKGIVGGIFQALAVRHALLFGARRKQDATVELNPLDILTAFEKDFQLLADGKIELPSTIPSFQSGYEGYFDKLKIMRKFLIEGNEHWSIDSVRSSLGVQVTALESVPTAFFCFLAAFKDIQFIKAENQFHRTIQLAISLGGDTDTIGAMAGAIAGGFLGSSEIPDKFRAVCEDYEGIRTRSKQLYEITILN